MRIGIMHITDTLDAGGAERIAVHLVNLLPRADFAPHLCTTRRDGALGDLVAADVNRLRLVRRHRFDVDAIRRLCAYVREHRIRILHAHGTSLFVAVAAASMPPYPVVVWHDHYGRCEFDDRPVWLYRLATRRVAAIIAVNEKLADWAKKRLRVAAERVWYVPNFAVLPSAELASDLPGERGQRIVCVANFRPAKDHFTLIRAMKRVVTSFPNAHLLLVGVTNDALYRARVSEEIVREGLTGNVSILGQRADVAAILRACDIGVLASASEGFPVTLLEYGLAALPSVATRVGQCAEALDGGRTGLLISPGAPDELAAALCALLGAPDLRARLGEAALRRVQSVYSPSAALKAIERIYALI